MSTLDNWSPSPVIPGAYTIATKMEHVRNTWQVKISHNDKIKTYLVKPVCSDPFRWKYSQLLKRSNGHMSVGRVLKSTGKLARALGLAVTEQQLRDRRHTRELSRKPERTADVEHKIMRMAWV